MSSNITTVQEASIIAANEADAATAAAGQAAIAAMQDLVTNPTNSTSVINTSIINPNPVSKLLSNLAMYQYNPAAIQSAVLQTLSKVTNGTINIVDPTNPFVFCLEAASVLTASFMIKNEANTRKLYPFSSQLPEELYLHMSDIDYINRFAVPTSTTFNLLIPLNEALAKMVANTSTGTNMLVIPRNSYFTVTGINFSIQYPIIIEQLQHGGLQVSYDTTVLSPLQKLTTNAIQYEIRQSADGYYIFFDFEATQFDIISQTGVLNSATDFSMGINFTDQYYYCRVYVENTDSTWSEIRTTHTAEVYDINIPTAVIKVINNANSTSGGLVTVSIPQIYTATGILNSGIRIDVYETKGPLELILWEYPFSAFTATWLAIDPNDSNVYTAPLNTLNTVIPFSTSIVSGGKNTTSFTELRNQVITNSLGSNSIPITNANIENTLSIDGYSIIKNIDNITNRVFLASKGMPDPINTNLITPAGSMVATITTTINQLTAIGTVIDNTTNSNSNSITITPDTLYQDNNGIVTPVSSDQLTNLLNQSSNILASNVSNGNYLYTPFHYVLDLSNNEFNIRPYYLDAPTILTQLFTGTNASTLLQVNTGTYSIVRTATGYSIIVVTLSTSAYQALNDNTCYAQLSFMPSNENTLAYINGTFLGTTADKERIYSFDLSTNFNVDINDCIELSQFLMYASQPKLLATPLITNFNVTYATTTPMGPQWIANSVDKALGKFLLPTNIVGITTEVLRVEFGYALKTLWAKTRSTISTIPYKKWGTPVYRTYEADVYQLDENGSAVTFNSNCMPEIVLLHAKGDPVLDSNGNQILLHNVGDIVLDIYGNPVPDGGRDIVRQIDIMLIDGTYWFANDISANTYRKIITTSLITWLTNDLVNIDAQLLEQTNIYFYPNITLGTISALVDNGVLVNLNASQKLVINLSVPLVVYNDNTLTSQLHSATITTVASELAKSTFSIDSITTALRSVYGTDVVAIEVSGIGGSNNYNVVSITNTSQRCSIAKQLTALPDNSLIVNEAITINFVLYQP